MKLCKCGRMYAEVASCCKEVCGLCLAGGKCEEHIEYRADDGGDGGVRQVEFTEHTMAHA